MFFIESVKTLIGLTVLFSLLEGLSQIHKQSTPRARHLTNLAHYLLTQTIAVGVLIWVERAYRLIAGQFCSDLQLAFAKLPVVVQFGTMLLAIEFIAYSYHRASHTCPLLWKFHAIHHSSEQLNWLAATRFHPLDIVFSRSIKLIPLALTGFSFAPFTAWLILDTFHGHFIHANISFEFPILNKLVVTPQFHHWHHANQPAFYDKNYGGLIPWFDVLFRTYRVPIEFPAIYGIDEKINEKWWQHMLNPFKFNLRVAKPRLERVEE